MNLDYAINILKSEKANCKKYISIYKEQKRTRFNPSTNYEERISLCEEQIKTLNEAIKILSRSNDKEKEKP